MSAKTGCFALFLSVFLSLPALAAEIESCKLEGDLSLKEDTIITCTDDSQNLILSRGGHLIRNGHHVLFQSERGIVNDGFEIDSYQGDYPEFPNGKEGGLVEFRAEWIAGTCGHIHNDGYKNGFGGTTVYRVLSYYDTQYGPYKCSDMTVSGIGQGLPGRIVAFADVGEIPFEEFASHVMN